MLVDRQRIWCVGEKYRQSSGIFQLNSKEICGYCFSTGTFPVVKLKQGIQILSTQALH